MGPAGKAGTDPAYTRCQIAIGPPPMRWKAAGYSYLTCTVIVPLAKVNSGPVRPQGGG